jgi:hypothetical protein
VYTYIHTYIPYIHTYHTYIHTYIPYIHIIHTYHTYHTIHTYIHTYISYIHTIHTYTRYEFSRKNSAMIVYVLVHIMTVGLGYVLSS